MAKKKFTISSPVAKAEKYTKELINGERGKGDNKEKLSEGQRNFRLGYRTAVNDTRQYRKTRKALAKRRKAKRNSYSKGEKTIIHLHSKPRNKKKGKKFRAKRHL